MPNTKIYLHNIDLSQNQLINSVLENSATAPVNPVDGQIYYNTVDKQIYFYNAGDLVWKSVDSEYKNSSWYNTVNNASQWDQAYSWGDHAQAGYLAVPVGTGLIYSNNGSISYVADNSANWDQAFSWGNHALVGYKLDNVYTNDGSLTGDRTITGGSYKLTLNTNLVFGKPIIDAGYMTGGSRNNALYFDITKTHDGSFYSGIRGIYSYISTVNTGALGNLFYETIGYTSTVITEGGTTSVPVYVTGGVFSAARGNSVNDLSTANTNFVIGINASANHYSSTNANIYSAFVRGVRVSSSLDSGTIANYHAFEDNTALSMFTNRKNVVVNNYYAIVVRNTVGTSSGPTAQILNYYGLYLGTITVNATGSVGLRWGVYAPDSAMNHYMEGNVLLGTTSNSGLARLQVAGSIQQSGVVSSMLKADSNGKLVAAVAGTDYYTLPSQPGAGNYYLSSDGVSATWASISGLSENIYNTNGSLTSDRTVGAGSGPFKLIFQPTLELQGKVSGFSNKTSTYIGGTTVTRNTTLSVDSTYSTTTSTTDSRVLANIFGTYTNNSTTTVSTSLVGMQMYLQGLGTTSNSTVNLTGITLSLERGVNSTELSTAASSMIGMNIILSTGSTATNPYTVSTVKNINSFQQFFSGTFTDVYGIHNNNLFGRSSVSKGVTATNYYGYYFSLDVGWSSGLGGSITNAYAFYIAPYVVNSTGTIVNRWGIYAPDSYSNHYINGNILVGTTTPSGAKLQVSGTIQQSNALSSMVKADASGFLVPATLGVDYSVIPSHIGYNQRVLYSDGTTLSWQSAIETDPIYTSSTWYYTPNNSTLWDYTYSWITTIFPSQTGNSGKYLTTNGNTLSWASVVSGVSSFNTRTGDVTLSLADVTGALGYTPVTNSRTLTINGVSYDLSADRSWTIAGGVTSFNTRTGAITLTSSDVTDALGFTPVSTNLYTADGTISSVRTITTGDKTLVFNASQPAANYTFTVGVPPGAGQSWPATFVRAGEFNMSTTSSAEPENSRYWGRNQTTALKTLYVNQSYADVTAETTGSVSLNNQIFKTSRGSQLDISPTVNSFSNLYGVRSQIGHPYSGTSATTTQIYTQGATALTAEILNYVGTITNVFGLQVSLQQSTPTNSQNSTITNFYGIRLGSFTIGTTTVGGPTATLTNFYGLYIDAPNIRTTGTVVNRWGIYAFDSAMRHYLNGDVLIGSVTPASVTAKLQVTGTILQTAVTASLLKADADGRLVAATAGVDYQTPVTLSSLGGVPTTRTLTINGVTYDLSANQTWTVSTGSSSMTTLTDVAITSVANNQLLKYNSTSSKWENWTPNYLTAEADTLATVTARGSSTTGAITVSGNLTVTGLTGTGSRMVVSDASGVLSTQAIPTFTYGIGSTVTSATQGSVLFAGASGVLSQNNSAFYWDNSNSRLGINTTSPQNSLDINGTARIQDTATIGAVGFTTKLNAAFGTFGIQSAGVNNGFLVDNGYYDGANVRYRATGYTAILQFINGGMIIQTAASGTAGTVATTTTKFSFTNTGDLSVTGSAIFGASSIVASAQLQVDSTTKGFLPPRMTAGDRGNINSPAAGLIVYQTDGVVGLYIYNGTAWKALTMV